MNFNKNTCKCFDSDCIGLDHTFCASHEPSEGVCPFVDLESCIIYIPEEVEDTHTARYIGK
jgi:hypothetical protein